jgi:hypothetical protein
LIAVFANGQAGLISPITNEVVYLNQYLMAEGSRKFMPILSVKVLKQDSMGIELLLWTQNNSLVKALIKNSESVIVKEKWSSALRIKMVKKLLPYLLVVASGQNGDELFLVDSENLSVVAAG